MRSQSLMYWNGLIVTAGGSLAVMAHQYTKELVEPKDLKKVKNQNRLKAVEFKSIRHTYVIGFTLMSLADWLQGPFLLPMYDSFGLRHSDVAVLYAIDYCVGIGAGLLAGGLADTLGARKACIVYGYLYAASCLCNHFSDVYMPIVALGCAIDGLCNALLRTSFESWLTSICARKGFREDWVAHAGAVANWFSTLMSLVAGLLCHSIVNVVALCLRSIASEQTAEKVPSLAYIATMDAAACLLVCGSIYVARNWEEDGDLRLTHKDLGGGALILSSLSSSVNNLKDGLVVLRQAVRSNRASPLRSIILLEVAFEASLMIFIGVFPMAAFVIDPVNASRMMGVLFVSLMGSILFGSTLANVAINTGLSVAGGWMFMSVVASFASTAITYLLWVREFCPETSLDQDWAASIVFVSLCVLEACFGFYYPYLALMHNTYAVDGLRNSCVAIVRSCSYSIALLSLFGLWLTNSVTVCWLGMLFTSVCAVACSLYIREIPSKKKHV